MRIAVIDTLIQTVNFDEPVRGGLVKAAMLDVIALSQHHDVYYLYYGKPTYDYKFVPIILNDVGLKDLCLKNNKKVSLAHHELKKDTQKIIESLGRINPDAIIINVCSKSSYLLEIAKHFNNIPKIYVFYDGVSNDDLFGTAGIIGTILKLKKFDKTLITTISNYTKDSITKVMIGRENDLRNYYEFMEEIKDVNIYQLFDKVFDYFVYYDKDIKLDIVENKSFSVNIGRYQKKKGVLLLLELHKYNNHRVKLYGVKDPVFDPGLKDYKKLKEAEEKYDNYELCEGYSDEELREDAKYGKNIVISCTVEGFGYTAFEMGIFGMPCVILKRGERHATEEYLKKIKASYVSIDMKDNKNWKKDLYEAMMITKLSKEEKRKNAQKFLDYFTIENYINERESFIELAKEKTKVNLNKVKLF